MTNASAFLLCLLATQPPTDEMPAAQVGAVLVVASSTSSRVVAIMRTEAALIWSRHGVRIRWRTSASELDEDASVVVLLSPPSRRCPVASGGGRPLGCFPAHQSGDALPVITIFPDEAYRLAAGAAARFCQPCADRWLEQLTGRILARTLAHELGHYLLGPEHTTTGLMRPRYRPDELIDADEDAFSLTRAQVTFLRQSRYPRR